MDQIFAPMLFATASQGINNDEEDNALNTNDDISRPVDIMRQLPTASPDPNIIQPLARGLFPSSASDTSTTTDSTGQNMPSASNDHQPAFPNVMYGTQPQQIFRYILENLGTIFNTAMQTTGNASQLEVDLLQFLWNTMQAVDNMSQSVTGALPTPILPPLRPRPNQTPYMSGEHNCHSCELGYNSKSGLEKHKGSAKHHTRLQELNPDTELRPRRVLCDQCESAFADAYSLSRHKKKQHAESA